MIKKYKPQIVLLLILVSMALLYKFYKSWSVSRAQVIKDFSQTVFDWLTMRQDATVTELGKKRIVELDEPLSTEEERKLKMYANVSEDRKTVTFVV